jgi:hypothetical protein
MTVEMRNTDYRTIDQLFTLSLEEVREVLSIFRYVYEFRPNIDMLNFCLLDKKLNAFRDRGSTIFLFLTSPEKDHILCHIWWYWNIVKNWTSPVRALMNRFLISMTLDTWAEIAQNNYWEKADVQIRDYSKCCLY